MVLAEEVQTGHVAILPLKVVNALQNLWLSPVAVIPQVWRRPHLIFDLTWSELNEASKRLAPMEVVRSGGALQRILGHVLTDDPCLGPVYIIKLDLSDAYMRLWVRMEDILSIAFLIPKKNLSNPYLVGFRLPPPP